MTRRAGVVATFPADQRELVIRVTTDLHASAAETVAVRLASGLDVVEVSPHPSEPLALLARVDLDPDLPLQIDHVELSGLRTADGTTLTDLVGPEFIHGVRNPMDLKISHLEGRFPFGSTLAGKHVTVSCCTGCNGGVHDRGLVVLNNHIGGPWSSIWVQTAQRLEMPYPRWLKVRMAGGVLEEQDGSTVVVDHGWMQITKLDEPEHHAPPALPITTADLPADPSRLLIHKSLDAAYVEFRDISIISIDRVDPAEDIGGETPRLPRLEVRFSDPSGGQTVAWLYHAAADAVEKHPRVALLRGFVHAEAPGHYVILSDKTEDIVCN